MNTSHTLRPGARSCAALGVCNSRSPACRGCFTSHDTAGMAADVVVSAEPHEAGFFGQAHAPLRWHQLRPWVRMGLSCALSCACAGIAAFLLTGAMA